MKSSTSCPAISSSGYPKRRSKAGLQSWTLLFESRTTLASGLFSTMAVRKALRSPTAWAIRSGAFDWISVSFASNKEGVVISGEPFFPFPDADLPFLRLGRAESTLIGIEFQESAAVRIARTNLPSNCTHVGEGLFTICDF